MLGWRRRCETVASEERAGRQPAARVGGRFRIPDFGWWEASYQSLADWIPHFRFRVTACNLVSENEFVALHPPLFTPGFQLTDSRLRGISASLENRWNSLLIINVQSSAAHGACVR